MATFRLQSAMEYLMTYGWAILVIAIVLGALFALGFFNNILAPTTSQACEVYRSGGPFSTSFINTEGACSNELPRYVALFNGQGQYVSLTNTGTSAGSSDLNINTVTFWMDWRGPSNGVGDAFSFTNGGANSDGQIGFNGLTTTGPCFGVLLTGYKYGANSVVLGNNNFYTSWTFVAVELGNGYSGTPDVVYINGIKTNQACSPGPSLGTGQFGAPTYSTAANIGASGAGTNSWNGLISNVQIYNISLTSNVISAMYDEGIGGVPLSLNNLVGWWPLNGNPYDYSGNIQNGAIAGSVSFTNSWVSAYSAP